MSVWSRVREQVAAWNARRRYIRDFESIDAKETERILHDVGFAMSDLPLLTRPHAGPDTLLPRRLAGVGLDAQYLAVVDPATLHDLQRTCTRCTNWRACARDLAHGDVQTGLDHYCPNAHTIDALLLGTTTSAASGAGR